MHKGSEITFCWIPSHCGLFFNEKVNKLAKNAASNKFSADNVDIPLSLHEFYNIIKSKIWGKITKNQNQGGSLIKTRIKNIPVIDSNGKTVYDRNIISLMCRWKLNAFKTKFVKNIFCVCGSKITIEHILECNNIKEDISILNP